MTLSYGYAACIVAPDQSCRPPARRLLDSENLSFLGLGSAAFNWPPHRRSLSDNCLISAYSCCAWSLRFLTHSTVVADASHRFDSTITPVYGMDVVYPGSVLCGQEAEQMCRVIGLLVLQAT